MTRKERLTQRNDNVRQEFNKLTRKNPQWRIDALIDAVADKFFLAPRTVTAIISHEGIYNDSAQTSNQVKLEIF
jgi:hypothetical protein